MDDNKLPPVPTIEEIAQEHLVIWMNNALPDCAMQGIANNLLVMTHALYPGLNKLSFKIMPDTQEAIKPGCYQLCQAHVGRGMTPWDLISPGELPGIFESLHAVLFDVYTREPVVRGSVRLMLTYVPDNYEFIMTLMYAVEKETK